MKVDYFLIRDIVLDGKAESDEEIAAMKARAAEIRQNRFSITSVCAAPDTHKIYCGCTNTGGDILWEFDAKTRKMRTLNFAPIAEPCDAKIHRGLWLDRERNSLYFGIATLSPTGTVALSAGARLMRFDIKSEQYEVLGRPSPGSYIQATAYDAKRQMMYAYTLPMLGFTATDIKTGKTKWNIPLESIVHIPAIDADGGVWGTADMVRQFFFRYDPDTDTFDFDEACKMPTSRQASNIMYTGAGPVDGLLLGPDGMLYVGSALGEIYQINPKTKQVKYLSRPLPFNRLPGLAFGPDGRLYGVGGDSWHTTLFAYDIKSTAVEIITELATEDRRCYRPHDMVFMDGTFYIGETDNPRQSGCLWAVTV